MPTIMSPPRLPASNSEAYTATNASHPFNKATADAILRTSDNVDFRVRRSILAEASCVFEDMLCIPQPPPGSPNGDELRDGLPVIRLAEDSATLDKLLRLCYPTDDPEFSSLDELRPVLEAAAKFMMQEATTLLRKRLVRLGQAQPIRALAIACALELEEEAQALAPLVNSVCASDGMAEDLDAFSAGVYYRVAHYVPASEAANPKSTARRGSRPILLPPRPPGKPQSLTRLCTTEGIPEELLHSPTADIVVRSADGVNFPLHSVILSLASPILREQVEEEMQSHGDLQGPPTLQLDEDSWILATLLQLIYPLPPPPPPASLDALKPLLAAADKYQLRPALSALRTCLSAFLLAPEQDPDPAVVHGLRTCQDQAQAEDVHRASTLRVFALAHRLGLADERAAAARALLRIPAAELRALYVPEFEDISAAAYLRLLAYHERCAQAASAAVLAHALRYWGVHVQVHSAPNISLRPLASPGTQTRGREDVGSDTSASPTRGSTLAPAHATARSWHALSTGCTLEDARAALISSRTHTATCHVVLDSPAPSTAAPGKGTGQGWAHFLTHSAPRWWLMYVYKLAVVLRRRPYVRGVVLDRGLRQRAVARALECVCCREKFVVGFEEYAESLAEEIEGVVAGVRLEEL